MIDWLVDWLIEIGVRMSLSLYSKVRLTPKYFFRLYKSFYVFEIHWAILSFFLNQILTIYRL